MHMTTYAEKMLREYSDFEVHMEIVKTPCGEIIGTKGRVAGTVAFKGIRYATAKRWSYPELVTKWDGIYYATNYSSCSYQPRAFYDEELNEKKYFYYNEFRKGESYSYSDDCLFLNIFAPENFKSGDNRPVIIYIHGGGFTGGCGHEKHFDGPVWPQKGIIAVTINYRLGPMGFLAHPELKKESGHTGNYGLFDQIAAIKWVKNNIAAFGGNPDNITIMGQSAGAMSVQLLCQSPITKGLFDKAVLSSGCGMATMTAGSEEKSFAFWQAAMKEAGCATIDEFRMLPTETIFNIWQNLKKNMKGGSGFPTKDGTLIIENSIPHDIPYMAGSTSHDMAPPVLLGLTKKWISKRTKPSYVWFFDRMLPGDDNGAWHSSDLWYWFGTLENCWRPMEEKDYKLSDEMVDRLCAFASFGNPNKESLPLWEKAGKRNKKVLCIGEQNSAMRKPKTLKLIHTMLTNKAVGE